MLSICFPNITFSQAIRSECDRKRFGIPSKAVPFRQAGDDSYSRIEGIFREERSVDSNEASIARLVIGRREAAYRLGTALRTWDRLVASGKTPKPIRLGGRPMWMVDELEHWVRNGCPERKSWEEVKRHKK
jgi:predicted DNA-binding transcriptional regulator AlpA